MELTYVNLAGDNERFFGLLLALMGGQGSAPDSAGADAVTPRPAPGLS
jgi:hypothetical protein